MKKRYMTAAAALITGTALCLSEASAAGQVSGVPGTVYESFGTGQGTEQEGDGIGGTYRQDVSSGDTVSGGERKMISLQIPQRFEIVIDPWKLDGKGQIYSEKYFIRNTGAAAGRLTLSFWCGICEENEIAVKGDKEGIHEDGSKSIFMEVVFGDGSRLVLSQEGSDYQAELGPGEELSLCFSGEVNENVSEQWKDGDVTVECHYFWDALEEAQFYENRVMEKVSSDIGAEENILVSGNDPFSAGEVENIFLSGSESEFPDRKVIGDRAENDSVSGNNRLFSGNI